MVGGHYSTRSCVKGSHRQEGGEALLYGQEKAEPLGSIDSGIDSKPLDVARGARKEHAHRRVQPRPSSMDRKACRVLMFKRCFRVHQQLSPTCDSVSWV